MPQNKENLQRPVFVLILLTGITLLGGFLRFCNIGWGLPAELQSDEFIEIYGSLGMAASHSPISDIFNQPNHFSMLINSILFQAYSFIRYGIPVEEIAFAEHRAEFWMICRCYGALIGTLSILIVYHILSFHSTTAALFGSFITALLPSYVNHSHLTLPDTPLTLSILCVIWFAIRFFRKPNFRNLVGMCVFSGISITIKYCGALAGLLAAFAIVEFWFKEKKTKKCLIYIASGLLMVFLTILIFAPALILNWKGALKGLLHEATVIHIGGDGGSFFQKMYFYIRQFFIQTGWLFIIPVLWGAYEIIKKKRIELFPLFFGFIYCVFMSCLQLHWERWALPMYTGGILTGAVGLAAMFRFFRQHQHISGRLITVILSCIFSVTMLSQSIAYLMNYSMPDTRVVSNKYCENNRIDKTNSIYQSNSPLAFITDGTSEEYNFYIQFISEDGHILLRENNPLLRYVILSSNMSDPYYQEPERYAYRIEILERIKEDYSLVVSFKGENYQIQSLSSIKALRNVIQYFENNAETGMRGPTIEIYEIP